MRQLTTEDLKALEVDLKNYFPQSLQVYGCIVQLNRNGQRADPVSVLADQWPEFRVLLIKPEFREKGDLFKDTTVFSKNDIYLRDLLAHSDVIDWKMFICLAAELHHEKMLEFVAINRGVPMKKEAVCYMLVLRDPSKLSQVDSSSLKLSSLNESHLALVNRSWKFGCEDSKLMIKNMILNFPSCCVLDSDDQPVAWILNYASSALGMLYTLPEHRGKGYAKALIAVMSKTLHSQGYTVYCFIEEENHLSYSLFTSLGFAEEPDYRAAWFVFNDL
ncbi:glycine N-acyltransferase isoform X1 [Sinocyclocheilus grahami]|uniref:glycine N-acyltransferase isoform X1 n=1 Tax=Sinocyclocheilus grahami TaxID=75366 RepID=UPI0007AD08D5|nr:PREDICTED: glycine N-acyltransferase-like isoform X1 [Sinocyclocheilus grahami]